MIHAVTDEQDFRRKLEEAGEALVVVNFSGAWCSSCRTMAPALDELAARAPHVVFLKVDVDELDSLAGEYRVTAVPTFVFVRSGEVVDSFSGVNEQMLLEKVHNFA